MRKRAYFSSLVHSLTVHMHTQTEVLTGCDVSQLLLNYLNMNNNNDVPKYYGNNSRLTSSYVTSTFNTNCLNFWKVHLKQKRLNQINLT